MGEVLGKILDWVKSPRQIAPVFLFCVVVLILPRRLVQGLQLTGFERYRGWVAIVALASLTFLLVESSRILWDRREKRKAHEAMAKRRESTLETLSAEEKAILFAYMHSPSDAHYLRLNDGNVSSLINKEVLYVAAKTGEMTWEGPMFAVAIQPWAKQCLKEKPHLLDNYSIPRKLPGLNE